MSRELWRSVSDCELLWQAKDTVRQYDAGAVRSADSRDPAAEEALGRVRRGHAHDARLTTRHSGNISNHGETRTIPTLDDYNITLIPRTT